MPMTGREMIKYLLRNGMEKVKGGGKGGHQKMINPLTGQTTEVPSHSKELGKGIERVILKQIGLLK